MCVSVCLCLSQGKALESVTVCERVCVHVCPSMCGGGGHEGTLSMGGRQ